MNQLGVILLAAGQGTRMKSAVPKVLHSLGGKALFLHVLENARRLDPAIIAIVVGHAARRVQDACPVRDINWAIQEEQLGTGHAVLCAQDKFHEFAGDILILSGDVPLIQEQTLRAMIENQRSSRADLSFLTAQLDNPKGYGRILRNAQGAIAGIEDASVRALAKVQQVMPPRLRRRVEALRAATVPAVWSSGPTIDPEALTAVAQACRDEERIRFAYTAQSGEETARHVEPYRLVSLGRRWYLVAYDLVRLDWRIFRLDRLEKARSTALRFSPRELPAEDAAAYVRASLGHVSVTAHTVEVLVHAPATTVRPMVGQWATIEEIDEQRCHMRMTADNLDWPAHALGSLGAEFEVLGPPEMVAHLREWGARFIRGTET